MGVLIFQLAIVVFMIASIWKVFTKAGQPGWAAIVPFYNIYIFTVIAKKPGWWVAMYLIPIANLIFHIMLMNGISKAFGKTEGFTAGLVLLGIVFWPILGFGDAQYIHKNTKENDAVLDVA